MKLLEPRRKRRVTAVPRPPFPIQIESETGIPASRSLWQVYTGIFNGDCVVVDEPHEMDIIFNMGFFGKGSLSRGGPEFGKVKKNLPPYLRNRQWLRRKEWAEEQEKIERAANNECISKDQMLMDETDTEKGPAETENSVNELVGPAKSGEVNVATAGPSGNIPQRTTDNSVIGDSPKNEVITLEVPDVNIVQNVSKAGPISNVATATLKEMDVVVLSDEEAPKRRVKCLNSLEEIEVIDDSSSDAVCKSDMHTATREGERTTKVESAVGKETHDIVEDSSPVHEVEEKRPDVKLAELVIDIVDTRMHVDVPVLADCSGSRNKVEKAECEENKDSSCSAEVVMVQDSDNRSGTDVVMVEDADNSCGGGMDVTQVRNDDYDGSESEESDTEEQCKRTAGDKRGSKVLVLPDSDSEDEGYKSYVKNLRARLEWEQFSVRETLHLSLEEAYFLSYGLGCLQVLDPFGNVLSLVDIWKMFREAQRDFVPKYVAYHYLRAKGWIVRSGLKYGGDFMLYKQGPVFYHASYVVIVEVLQAEDWTRHPTLNSRSFSWSSMTTLNRVVTAAGKELLICQVIWPAGVAGSGPDSPAAFPQFAVNEVLMRRWVAAEEREKEEESVDWDGQ